MMPLRLLRAVLGVPSPSVLASVRRADPPPRSWLARQERAVALRALGDRLSYAEQAEAELVATFRYAEDVAAGLAGGKTP